MEYTELSLAGGQSMKRKWNDHNAEAQSVDLQLKHPLPSDWEQCLDLQSGRMYYVNRKTSRRSWKRPDDHHEEQNHKLDLELNISTGSSSTSTNSGQINEYYYSSTDNSTSNMVALACSNCHLLVILSRSSPSCPNCKYVHSLASNINPH